ncbi:MAG: hypothetical protein KC912_12050 [Proteobacteria bacterium]|nr:hypothetical protein [Pseudomonadota bacterium]
MLDTADRIAVALQVLIKRRRVDLDALGAVLAEVHPPDIVERAMVRGVGVVCSSEVCAAWPLVPASRRDEVRALIDEEGMLDLLGT